MTKISNIKNIILIGRTGKGKTTIANLISDADFEENNNSISGTKKTQTKIFSFEEKDYRVVDTIGIGDTKMKKENVLLEIARGCKITAKGGIAQILFVTGGKFTNEEIKVYNLIRNVFFNNKVDKDISNYTTIVRTNFNNFTSKEECEKDKRVLIEENDLIREIIENCQGKIIHINASSLDIRGNDVETIELEKKLSKRRRDLSREVILKELKN
jgi:GTPase Era involved in 16S rRNA processing